MRARARRARVPSFAHAAHDGLLSLQYPVACAVWRAQERRRERRAAAGRDMGEARSLVSVDTWQLYKVSYAGSYKYNGQPV